MNTFVENMKRHFNIDVSSFEIDSDMSNVINMTIESYLPRGDDPQLELSRYHALAANKSNIITFFINSIDSITYKDADHLMTSLDSFGRPYNLSLLYNCMDRLDWLRLFKETWTMCDSCSLYHDNFRHILNQYTLDEIRTHIQNDDDRIMYDSLPDIVDIYRGTFVHDDFRHGLSWTTDIKVAEQFANGYKSFAEKGPMYFRYMCNMDLDTLNRLTDIASDGVVTLKGQIDKSNIFVITNRGESEIIVLDTDYITYDNI